MNSQPEQRSRDYLASLFQGDQRAVLAFSGGKDSLVMADLCRPYKDRITLAWVNTGAMFPHMEAFIRGYAADWHYAEIPSDVQADIAESGWPSYMVPAANVAPLHPLEWLAGSVPPFTGRNCRIEQFGPRLLIAKSARRRGEIAMQLPDQDRIRLRPPYLLRYQ